jgi:cephalosporin hydroxylase
VTTAEGIGDGILIDLDRGVVIVDGLEHPLGSETAFRAISRAWVRCGWELGYPMSFSWLGRRVLQLPDDLLRLQEVVHRVRPDVIVESGVFHGGSLLFQATLCRATGRGRVIGVDLVVSPELRRAIAADPLGDLITLVEGDSADPAVAEHVHALIEPGERVLVVLDSAHAADHVLAEMRNYCDLVGRGSYLVVADGVMRQLADSPVGRREWADDSPARAIEQFVAERPDFAVVEPRPGGTEHVTLWSSGFVQRIR